MRPTKVVYTSLLVTMYYTVGTICDLYQKCLNMLVVVMSFVLLNYLNPESIEYLNLTLMLTWKVINNPRNGFFILKLVRKVVLHEFVDQIGKKLILASILTAILNLPLMLTSQHKNNLRNRFLTLKLVRKVVLHEFIDQIGKKLILAAILSAILNFSKRSRISAWYPPDIFYRGPKVTKSIEKKTLSVGAGFGRK